MTPRPLRAILDEVAARQLPADHDLWPALRRRVAARAPRDRRRARHRRPALALLGAAVLLAALLTASGFWPDGQQTASAQAILALTRAAAASQTPRYHLTATLQAAGTAATLERWYGGGGRLRDETRYRDPDGRVTTTVGLVADGTQAWHFLTADDRTQYAPGPLPDPRNANPLRGGAPADGTDLPALLTSLGRQGCGTPHLQGTTEAGGRAVHVIVVANTGSCHQGDAGGRLVIRVDQQTYLVLGWERYGPDGTLLGRYTVDTIAYDVPLPDALFTYTPPPDAQPLAPGTPGTPGGPPPPAR